MSEISHTITREQAQLRAAKLDVHHYQIDIDVTDDTEFRVETVITFSASHGAIGHTGFIDLVGHQVASAQLNGRDVTYDGARLALTDLREDNELVVSSAAPYSTTGEGLHRYVDPFDEAEYLYSQCEPADARRIFPVFEQPDLKATFQLNVTAPAHWSVISNEPGEYHLDGDVAQWTFAATPVMSSYLFALIAGEYTQVATGSWDTETASVPLSVWARKSQAPHVEGETILDITRSGFNFYEQQFGLAYPFTKYDQIFVPEFNAGAMENVGAVTITESYIFRSAVPQAMVERRAVTILHELAHMWFGNLVTMRWWDDLWLNESFAEFVSHLAAIEAGFPDAWTTFNASEKTWAYRQDQLATTHPVIADMVDLDAVAVNFDGITYAKGASVLRQLVAWVGTDEFMAGVRTYFAEHAWSNTEFSDLLRHLEQASGRDLSLWSDMWLHTNGVTTLTWERHLNDLIITQSDPVRDHRVGIGFYDFVDGPLTRTGYVETDLKEETTTIPTNAAPLVVVNDGDLTYAKLRPDRTSLGTLTEHLGVVDDSLTRSLLWGAAWDQTRDGEASASWFLELILEHVGSETDSSVVFSLLRQAATALDNFIPLAQSDLYREHFARGLWRLAEHAESGSDIQLQLVQAYIRHARERTIVAQLAENHGLEGFSVSTDMAWSALQRLVALGDADEPEIAAALAEDDSSTGHLAAVQARAMIPTPEAKAEAWDNIVSGDLTNLELRHTVMGFHDVHHAALLAPYVNTYFNEIDELWSASSFETAETLALGLFPMWAISEQTAHETITTANSTNHSGLQRILTELHDDVRRALAARAAF